MANQANSLFVILPNVNIWNAARPGTGQTFMRSMSRQLQAKTLSDTVPAMTADLGVELIDQVGPGDTVLVSMKEEERVHLLRTNAGLRIVPVELLDPLWLRRIKLRPALGVLAGPKRLLEVTVTDAVSGAPLRGVEVVGFTDRSNRVGVLNKTGANGVAKLLLPGAAGVLDAVEAHVPKGYWPSYATKVDPASGTLSLSCTPIDLSIEDIRGDFGFQGAMTDGEGVKVGVVDSGVSAHPDLRFKGVNVVRGEGPKDCADVLGHGTHVAGIIAGRARPGTGVRGVAPGVDLRVYRVFAKGQEQALSFNIAKGIRQAVDDGCDLINLSLGGEVDVPDVLREIQRARAMGVVCVAAAGNDYRGAVNYPARYPPVLAVSAFGRKGTYPARAAQELEAVKPFGTDKKDFVAGFSNVGSEVELTAPGVGVVSVYPGGYAVMDGTSMACPVTTGALARLLATRPKILAMDRAQARSDAIFDLAIDAANTRAMGFGVTFEGAGLLE
jgi:subtilisin family serine protease